MSSSRPYDCVSVPLRCLNYGINWQIFNIQLCFLVLNPVSSKIPLRRPCEIPRCLPHKAVVVVSSNWCRRSIQFLLVSFLRNEKRQRGSRKDCVLCLSTGNEALQAGMCNLVWRYIINVTGVATGCRLDGLVSNSGRGKRLLSSAKPSIPALESGRAVCYSTHSSAEVKNQWSYTSFLPVYLHGVDGKKWRGYVFGARGE
jgi:hypothetical protein